jgi:hypothetical protein
MSEHALQTTPKLSPKHCRAEPQHNLENQRKRVSKFVSKSAKKRYQHRAQ